MEEFTSPKHPNQFVVLQSGHVHVVGRIENYILVTSKEVFNYD